MAAHGAWCARKGGEGRGEELPREEEGERAQLRVVVRDVASLRLRWGGAGTTPGTLECRKLLLPAATKEMLRAPRLPTLARHPFLSLRGFAPPSRSWRVQRTPEQKRRAT